MEFLKELNPSTLLVVGLVLILREIFSFLKYRQKDRPIIEVDAIPRAMQLELAAITESLKKVATHIEAQTDLVRTFISELKAMREELERFRKELYDVSDRVREIN